MKKWLFPIILLAGFSFNSMANNLAGSLTLPQMVDHLQHLAKQKDRSIAVKRGCCWAWGLACLPATCGISIACPLVADSNWSDQRRELAILDTFLRGFQIYARAVQDSADGIKNVQDANEQKQILGFARYLMLEEHFHVFAPKHYQGSEYSLLSDTFCHLTFQNIQAWLQFNVVREVLVETPLFDDVKDLRNAMGEARPHSDDSYNTTLVRVILARINSAILNNPDLKQGFIEAKQAHDQEASSKA